MLFLLKGVANIARVLMYVAAVAGASMAVFVALSSIMRYLLGAPFRFTEELVGLLFAAMVFLTLPMCTVRRRHIRVTLIRDLLPHPLARISDLAAAAFTIAFAIIFCLLSFEFAAFSYRLKSMTDMSGLILYPWMGLMPVGVGLMGLAVLLHAIQDWLGKAGSRSESDSEF
jgi:TRAP-type C4-dicarboxylate transport system permease small subunit